MTDDKTQRLVSGIASGLSDAPKLRELEDGEAARLKLGYMKSKRRETEGVTVGFHFGNGTAETVNAVADAVEPLLDKRKFRVSTDQPKYRQAKSWDIGWVDVDAEGSIVDYEIKSDYLKPTEQ